MVRAVAPLFVTVTVLLDAVVTVPTTRPAEVMADVTDDCVVPTTLGTPIRRFPVPYRATVCVAEGLVLSALSVNTAVQRADRHSAA